MRNVVLAGVASLALASAAHAAPAFDPTQGAIAASQAGIDAIIAAGLAPPPVKAPPVMNLSPFLGYDPSATTGAQSTTATTTATTTTPADGATTNNSVGVQATSNVVEVPRQPVSTAYAAPLTFSTGTCYVSASAGGQGITFGLSAALPFEDKACTVRATVQALNALGEREAAIDYLAAHDKGVAEALRQAHSH